MVRDKKQKQVVKNVLEDLLNKVVEKTKWKDIQVDLNNVINQLETSYETDLFFNNLIDELPTEEVKSAFSEANLTKSETKPSRSETNDYIELIREENAKKFVDYTNEIKNRYNNMSLDLYLPDFIIDDIFNKTTNNGTDLGLDNFEEFKKEINDFIKYKPSKTKPSENTQDNILINTTELETKWKDLNDEKMQNEDYASSSAQTWSTSADADFENLSDNAKESVKFAEDLQKVKSEDEFIKLSNKFKNKRLLGTNMSGKKTSNSWYPLYTLERSGSKVKGYNYNIKLKKLSPKTNNDTLKNSYNLYKKDREAYINQLQHDIMAAYGGTWGSGLLGGFVKPRAHMNYNPNFGNLYLNEKSLKKNNFIVYRPHSKDIMISKKNISSLLKKMILDIQNTLEFDISDYNNLEGDEKRVIEKIIRLQKNMKEYNIEKLIDDDDRKIKKRLEILSGQVNAGNNSKLIRDEMIYLLKQLYDNKAISWIKYNSSVKAVKSLG